MILTEIEHTRLTARKGQHTWRIVRYRCRVNKASEIILKGVAATKEPPRECVDYSYKKNYQCEHPNLAEYNPFAVSGKLFSRRHAQAR